MCILFSHTILMADIPIYIYIYRAHIHTHQWVIKERDEHTAVREN